MKYIIFYIDLLKIYFVFGHLDHVVLRELFDVVLLFEQ